MVIAGWAGVAPARAGLPVDNGDPVSTGCAPGSRRVAAYPITGNTLARAEVEVWYSPTCGTNWLRLRVPADDVAVLEADLRITVLANGLDADYHGRARDGVTTDQVRAPGATCVAVTAALRHERAVLGDTGPGITVC